MDILSEAKARAEVRKRAKTDGLFLGNLLGYQFQEDVHRELFDYELDTSKSLYDQDIPKDELILWPRGHYKTTARVVQAIQFVLNFPDIRIVLMQGTIKNTQGWLGEIKSHFTGEHHTSKLLEYFPELKLARLGSKSAFTVPTRVRKHLKEATFTVASAKSVKAGQHYDIGFFDDLVTEQNYRNPDIVEKVTEDFNHIQPLIDPGGYKRVSGTRYTFGDLYEQIIRHNQGKWRISVKTCWKEGTDKEPLFPARKLTDGRTIGFTRELLERIEQENGSELFSAQYLNNPVNAKTHLFPEQLILSRVKPAKDVPLLGQCIMFVDLASSRRSESDHSVIIAGKTDTFGNMYVVDCAGGQYSPSALAMYLMEMAIKHRPLSILIENTSAAKYFVEYVKVMARDRNLALPLGFIKIDNTKDAKYLRISGVAGYIPRLWFLPGLPNWERIVEEFNQFPKGRHDDYPDTIALMVKHFSESTPLVRPDPFAHPMLMLRNPVDEAHVPMSPSRSEGQTMGGDFAC